MEGANRTTRQRITDRLRDSPARASELADEFEVTTQSALSHVQHVARTLSKTDEQLLVAPPTCRDCGFDDFDDVVNRPSRCPQCKSEDVEEPTFVVE